MNYRYNLINIKGGFFMSLLPKELIKEIVRKGNFNSAAAYSGSS